MKQKYKKMKKTFRVFSMIMFVMLMTVCFSACSSDDDDDKNPSIVGTWYTETTCEIGTEYENIQYTELIFKKDGTVTGYWKYTYKNGKIEIETNKGRYEVIKDTLCIWLDGEDDVWTTTISISGNKMTTTEGDRIVWTRK
ncbi:MAG: lipocalin family protein [Bacteroides sp.]|nr:lipocalin family protein [Bacteroides sp.]